MEDEEVQSKLSINDLLRGEDSSGDSIEEEMLEEEDPGSDWEDDNGDKDDEPRGGIVVKEKTPGVTFAGAPSSSSSSYAGRQSTLLKAINEQENIRPDDIETSK